MNPYTVITTNAEAQKYLKLVRLKQVLCYTIIIKITYMPATKPYL